MAYIKLRKRRNRLYAYEVTSYRDLKTRQVRKSERYIGPATPEQVEAWQKRARSVAPHKTGGKPFRPSEKRGKTAPRATKTPESGALAQPGLFAEPQVTILVGDVVRHSLTEGWLGEVVAVNNGRAKCKTLAVPSGNEFFARWHDHPMTMATRYLTPA